MEMTTKKNVFEQIERSEEEEEERQKTCVHALPTPENFEHVCRMYLASK